MNRLGYVTARRPPVEEIEQFLENEKAWIIPRLFTGKDINQISHAVAGK